MGIDSSHVKYTLVCVFACGYTLTCMFNLLSGKVNYCKVLITTIYCIEIRLDPKIHLKQSNKRHRKTHFQVLHIQCQSCM